MSSISRRSVLVGAAAATVLAATAGPVAWRTLRQPRARVTTLSAPSYDIDLVDLVLRGIKDYPDTVARAKGARVVLKPNLVEWDPTRPINTDPRLVAAVATAFLSLGAKEVVVGEGPGHRRDTELLLEQTGLRRYLIDLRLPFVDLNLDIPRRVELPSNYTGFGHLELAGTASGADLLVSMPKLKTHHWAGVTLSMKNLFGVVPSAVYGWPKNPLHQHGIEQSIVDLWVALKPGFAVVDGIVGMEGDGPLKGSAVPMGIIVMGDQLPAVDATCARLMRIDPRRIDHLAAATSHGGTVSSSRIAVEGDVIPPRPFELVPHFAHYRV